MFLRCPSPGRLPLPCPPPRPPLHRRSPTCLSQALQAWRTPSRCPCARASLCTKRARRWSPTSHQSMMRLRACPSAPTTWSQVCVLWVLGGVYQGVSGGSLGSWGDFQGGLGFRCVYPTTNMCTGVLWVLGRLYQGMQGQFGKWKGLSGGRQG